MVLSIAGDDHQDTIDPPGLRAEAHSLISLVPEQALPSDGITV